MARKWKMRGKKNRKNFTKGTRVHKRNFSRSMRGGYRL